jgi:hypothetical protein
VLRLSPFECEQLVQSAAFEDMKAALFKVRRKAAEEEKCRPSLLAAEQGCPAPKKIEYKSGQPIEALCSVAEHQGSSGKK